MSHPRRVLSNQSNRNVGMVKQNSPYKQQMKLPRLLSSGDGPNPIEQYGLDMGASSQQGRRPYQEDEFAIRPFLKSKSNSDTLDTHFFGLFDGHAGGRCSKFVASTFTDILTEDPSYGHNLPQAVKRCFYNTNEQFLQIAERMKLHDGSTGICGIVRDGKVLVSNVGDCRCIILSNGKPIQMSIDQKPTSPDEQRRIASFGGTVVYCMGTARVNGVLAVSRAFGNRTLRSVIRPDPELSMREFTKDDDYLIMASDGLWDVLRNVDVSHIAYTCVNTSGHTAASTGPICQTIAEELVNAALSRGSMDNVTCICIKISGANGLYALHHGGANSNNSNNNQSRSETPMASGANSRAVSAANAYRNNFNANAMASEQSNNSIAPSNGNSAAAVADMLSTIMSSTSGGARGKSSHHNSRTKKPLYNNTNVNMSNTMPNTNRAMTPSNMESHSKEQEAMLTRPKLNKSQSLRRINEPYGASGNANALASMSIVENNGGKGSEDKQASSSLSRFMNASLRLRSSGNDGQNHDQTTNSLGYGSLMSESDAKSRNSHSNGQSMLNSKNSVAGHNGDVNNSYVISATAHATPHHNMLAPSPIGSTTKRPQSVGGNGMQHGGNRNQFNNNSNMPVIYGHNQQNQNRPGNSGLFNTNYSTQGNNLSGNHPNMGYH